MVSVIIAAHNEAAVLGRTLSALTAGTEPGELEIVVAANGCTDGTAAVAAAHPGVRVVEVDAASKPQALNAAEEVATCFPRIYLDADIVVPARGAQRLAAAVAAPGPRPLAAVPTRRLVTAGRPLPVRAYFAINRRLPVYLDGLFGRGMICLSESGRARFGSFPLLVADDLFLDSLFEQAEKTCVADIEVAVETPRRTGDLIRRLTRVRRGNAAMRTAGRDGQLEARVRPADRWSWWRQVVLPRPWLAPAGACYMVITLVAAIRARRSVSTTVWERDESSREVPVATV